MEKIRVGFVGLGGRGKGLLQYAVLEQCPDVVAVCDVYEDRMLEGVKIVEEVTGNTPAAYQDYRQMLQDPQVNTVIIATAWESHIEIAIAAMKAGKAVAMEVGGAYTVLPSGGYAGRNRNALHVYGKLLLRQTGNDGAEYGRAGSAGRDRPLQRRLSP